jgi:PTS system mannitol-specific IIA component
VSEVSLGAVRLAEVADSRFAAVRRCGEILLDTGAIRPAYIGAMLARERLLTTYVGVGVAIPHGTGASRADVLRDTLAVVRFPAGVGWAGDRVTLCVAIAAAGERHTGILAELARILLDPVRAEVLHTATDPRVIASLLRAGGN